MVCYDKQLFSPSPSPLFLHPSHLSKQSVLGKLSLNTHTQIICTQLKSLKVTVNEAIK